MYQDYKEVCRKIGCGRVHELKEIEKRLDNTDQCIDQRFDFMRHCLPPEMRDEDGHREQIAQLQRAREKCRKRWRQAGANEEDFPERREMGDVIKLSNVLGVMRDDLYKCALKTAEIHNISVEQVLELVLENVQEILKALR